ncbi:MAG: transposase [Firmicutes bacterium]|nr:transposase [Bacillota bacterium]
MFTDTLTEYNMALRAKKLFNVNKLEVLADKGYYKAEDLKKCVEHGITPYVTKQGYSNKTGDKVFYPEKFTYNKEQDIYICPAGQTLTRGRTRKMKGQIIGFDYHNFKACRLCSFKDRCTKSTRGRTIFRHKDQDFLDTINFQTELNKNKYKLRQMIVEHPFGTIKRSWGAYYFLTRRKVSVAAELSLTFLAYNMKRAMNILGAKEIVKRLRERRAMVLS